MFSLFVSKFLKTEDLINTIRPGDVDLIIPVCYVTRRDGLTNATRANLERAIELQVVFPEALIALSSCSYPFEGSELVEESFKREILLEAQANFISANPIINSVDEAEKIDLALQERGICPRGIIIVTGELHSRSARFIYKRIFPRANIFVTCTSYMLEVQPDHPVKDQRVLWRWTICNILRESALRLLPWKIVRKMKHRAVSH